MNNLRPRLAMIGFRAGAGGVGRVMTTLINALQGRGIAVDLLLPPGEHPDLDALAGQIDHWTIDATDKETARTRLQGYLKERRPDAILSNKDQAYELLKRSLLGPSRPFTALRIGTNVPEKLRRQNRLTAPWKQWRLAHRYRDADCLIGISPGVSTALGRMLGSLTNRFHNPPIHTIWNPVDRKAIRRMAAETPSHPWFTDKQGPLIVSVGRLVRAKNYGLLLRAFARLPGTLSARLLICGEGGQRERLTLLAQRLGIADRVDLVGHQRNPFPYVAAADLFVCSSLFEGANNALMEALTLGIPCVATDCPSGPREILEDGALGALAPVDDSEALSTAMQSSLASPIAPERLLMSAERFDPPMIAARYAEFLGLERSSAKETSADG